jgi:hypothetical protein
MYNTWFIGWLLLRCYISSKAYLTSRVECCDGHEGRVRRTARGRSVLTFAKIGWGKPQKAVETTSQVRFQQGNTQTRLIAVHLFWGQHTVFLHKKESARCKQHSLHFKLCVYYIWNILFRKRWVPILALRNDFDSTVNNIGTWTSVALTKLRCSAVEKQPPLPKCMSTEIWHSAWIKVTVAF